MMTDSDMFCEAMNGRWVVERYELENNRLRVHYRSENFPQVTWSHCPYEMSMVPAIGRIGRLGFVASDSYGTVAVEK